LFERMAQLYKLGQLASVIRGRYLVDAISYSQVRGLPFTAAELESMLAGVVGR
jgi:2-oxoglutarate ferredoxin oxidoreductase subunit alpha